MSAYPDFFPSLERIVELHDSAMKTYGGIQDGHVDRGCIEGARGATLNAALYDSDDGPDALQCAIQLFCRLNKKQCFTDGSKRTAWMSLCECLLLQGLRIEEKHDAVVDFCLDHAKGHGLQIDSAARWISARLYAA